MPLFKKLKKLKDELEYWESYNNVNNMGKWAVSVRIISLNKQIKKIEEELKSRKQNN